MRAPLYATLYDLEQRAVKAERRDLLPEIELAYWLLHHVCEELATDMQSAGRSAQAPEQVQEAIGSNVAPRGVSQHPA